MCQDCGCGTEHEHKTVDVNESLHSHNDSLAHDIWHALQEKEILCVNIMGSPGAGKTSVIESLAKQIFPSEIAVIQGDLESDVDKKRLEEKEIQTYQINTHSGCHLNADMIDKALKKMDLSGKKYLFIENVGNLVCPAGVKLGQHVNIVISSTTEGSDKPKKYPHIFMDAKAVVISKYDLKEAVDFAEETYLKDIENINFKAKIINFSTKQGLGCSELAHFLEHQRQHLLGEHHHH